MTQDTLPPYHSRMLRRDYLLRMIEEMGRIVARIRERLVGGDIAAVEPELQAAARLASLDLQTIRALTADSLLLLLLPAPTADAGRLKVVIQVLALDAERAVAVGNEEEAERLLQKAERLRQAATK